MPILTGKARKAGVIGYPVAHSRSPRLHGFWLDRHGIDGCYLPLPVAPEAFTRAVTNMRELADLVTKSQTEALEVVQKRVADSLDEIKTLVAKKK